MPERDEFLTDVYDGLHDSPAQRKFRTIAPMPVGTVFLQRPEMTEDDIRGHFRLMKKLGFTCLKGIMTCPGTAERQIFHMALDEGIIPWWYDEGGWETVTDDLLDRLRIPRDTPIAQVRTHPDFLAHQERVFRERIDRSTGDGPVDNAVRNGAEAPFTFDMTLHPDHIPNFVAWLRETYGTVDALNEAWNMRHVGIAEGQTLWATWDAVHAGIPTVNPKEYRHTRDIIRFKADLYIKRVRAQVDASLAADAHEPVRAGGEMGLFLPFASRATDMEGIAAEMTRAGSFYPSIHLAWHFEECGFEAARPAYMMASIAGDWFKGGWAASWESTGGPQQLSGGKGWEPEGQAVTAGYTVDAGVMTQLMLSYLAGGFKGFGFWCWNARSAGWEAGEFALLDRNCRPTDRAVRVGRIGQTARRYRDELWQARKEPMVGVLVDFDNEAIWAAVSTMGREKFKHAPVQARIGASRALIDHNVPWEHVTPTDLRKGLAGRYKSIYLPAMLALETGLLEVLAEYVHEGGRLAMDMPSAWYDGFGRLLPTGEGTLFERVFGCSIRDFQYSSNVPRRFGSRTLEGFVADLAVTHAQVLAEFDNGLPAITEASYGQGKALVLGYEASLLCARPGDAWAERTLVRHALDGRHRPYACEGAVVYRLAAPEADHYFMINDGPATTATLDTRKFLYRSVLDAVTQEALVLGAPIDLAAYDGRWLRFEK